LGGKKEGDPVDVLTKLINKNAKTKIKVTTFEVIEVIDNVGKMHRNKKFSYFTEDDIESQAKLICLQQMIHYEPSKASGTSPLNSLERWLNRVVKNRLSNYYRDNYTSVNKKHMLSRMNLANCLEFDSIDITGETSAFVKKGEQLDSLEYNEFVLFVEENLEDGLRRIYYDCLNDESVSSYYRSKLFKRTEELTSEWMERTGDISG
jgi:hypothetical protein